MGNILPCWELLQYFKSQRSSLVLLVLQVAKEELRRECDYGLEAINQKKFRKFLQDEPGLYVPLVIDEFSTRGVLTTELVEGVCLCAVCPIDLHAFLEQAPLSMRPIKDEMNNAAEE